MDVKALAIVFFYDTIRGMVQRYVGSFGIPVDFVLLAVGYYKRNTWWGEGLMYGAVASIGATMGFSILGGLAGSKTASASSVSASEYLVA